MFLLSKLILLFPLLLQESTDSVIYDNIHSLWSGCKLENVISYEIFNKAVSGLNKIHPVKNDIITIVDFSKPSSEKRFYVIDLLNRQLIYMTYVAHGKNSGENLAESFSNDSRSLMSSLGFYLTAETYSGINGYSLKLDGLEKGINDNARTREIVIHGADYVDSVYIRKYGRLGRSWGCPALPEKISKKIIDRIARGSCLFIWGIDKNYLYNSSFEVARDIH